MMYELTTHGYAASKGHCTWDRWKGKQASQLKMLSVANHGITWCLRGTKMFLILSLWKALAYLFRCIQSAVYGNPHQYQNSRINSLMFQSGEIGGAESRTWTRSTCLHIQSVKEAYWPCCFSVTSSHHCWQDCFVLEVVSSLAVLPHSKILKLISDCPKASKLLSRAGWRQLYWKQLGNSASCAWHSPLLHKGNYCCSSDSAAKWGCDFLD